MPIFTKYKMEIVSAIQQVATDENDRPLEDVRIEDEVIGPRKM